MAIDYDKVMAFPPIETHASYQTRDTMLYALGLGVGAEDPLDPRQLQFVYEKQLKALPTMAVILATPGLWMADPKYGMDWRKLLHAEQGLQLHRPLPVAAEVKTVVAIEEIYDKGAAKGALMVVSRKLYNEGDGGLLATLSQSYFLRGDGGFSDGSAAQADKTAPQPHPIPEREPDLTVEYRSRPDQALLYRLSGDYNPLHIDPEVAAKAGFNRPILHGLCTYGMAGRAVVEGLCKGNPEALTRFDVRFSRPVFPGDRLRFDFWQEGRREGGREDAGKAAFRAVAVERDEVVLNNGYAEFSE